MCNWIVRKINQIELAAFNNKNKQIRAVGTKHFTYYMTSSLMAGFIPFLTLSLSLSRKHNGKGITSSN